jgi:DNA-binding NtrC family response regulator
MTPMADHRKHPILIVDDEPDILFSLKGLLRREFELYTAESAREALKILAERSVHVVMTDQRMPETTGIELLGVVKQEYPDAIRIVFTGYADIKAVVDGINKGGLYRYITKPWDPDDLTALLHEAAARYDELAERQQLLIDLRTYLADTAGSESGRASELAGQSNVLLERIDKLIRNRAVER